MAETPFRPVTIEDTRVVTHEAATTNSVSASSSVGDAAREAVDFYFDGQPLDMPERKAWQEIKVQLWRLESRLATAEAERDRLLRFVTDGNALLARFSETRAYGCVAVYRMPETRSWFDTPEAAVADWLGRAPATGGTP